MSIGVGFKGEVYLGFLKEELGFGWFLQNSVQLKSVR